MKNCFQKLQYKIIPLKMQKKKQNGFRGKCSKYDQKAPLPQPKYLKVC